MRNARNTRINRYYILSYFLPTKKNTLNLSVEKKMYKKRIVFFLVFCFHVFRMNFFLEILP